MCLDFREEGEEREGKREGGNINVRNIDWFLPIWAPNENGTSNLGMSPNRGPKLQAFDVWDNTPINRATQPGHHCILF